MDSIEMFITEFIMDPVYGDDGTALSDVFISCVGLLKGLKVSAIPFLTREPDTFGDRIRYEAECLDNLYGGLGTHIPLSVQDTLVGHLRN